MLFRSVPGNLSVFIDDLTVIYTPNAEGSDNCTFEEYIPAYLTADGEYIKPLASGDELGKFELVKRVEEVMAGNGGISIWLSVIIGAATVALLGGGVTTVLLIRRKKRI